MSSDTTGQKQSRPQWFLDALAEATEQDVLVKRREQRQPFMDNLEVEFLTGPRRAKLNSRGQNVSETGLCIVSRSRIDLYVEVRLRPDCADAPQEWLNGRIIHCTQTVGGYKIGIQVD
jgi:hypothetical protein